ncbi:hypothetical protein [Acidovorax sp.]|uniref:hypothetical protein n=1 Tax=Acidovorax sp. TaxID=1872122 RepID=UPI0026097A5B|nr:hypothetical protein [Acidovorax sp.]
MAKVSLANSFIGIQNTAHLGYGRGLLRSAQLLPKAASGRRRGNPSTCEQLQPDAAPQAGIGA